MSWWSRSRWALIAGASFGVSLGIIPSRAFAENGFAVNRFDPAERGSSWFVLDSVAIQGHLRPALGVTGDWGYKPLVVYNADGSERGAIIEHQIVSHVGGSLVLVDRLRLGVSLPIALYQTGDAPQALGVRTASPETSVGDLRLGADVRVLGSPSSAFVAALGAGLYLPTGSRAQYTGDGNTRLSPRVSVAGEVDLSSSLAFAYGGRLGFNYRPLTERVATNRLGSELTIAASAGLKLLDKTLLVGPEIYGSSITSSGSLFEKATSPLEGVLGAHYTVAKDLRLSTGVGTGLTRGWGSPIVRVLLALEYAPGYDDDPDHDSIPSSVDACPNVAGVRTNDPKTNGCPPPPPPPRQSDRDHDGIDDPVDACPDVPGVMSADPTKNGCPPDRDGDGIEDQADACPDTPGDKSADPTKNGCPPDRDGDGVSDKEDACPDVPGEKTADPKTNGCPPDRDRDGIYDKDDACPDAPGPADTDPKKNGCPLARIEDGQVRIVQQVQFKTGSAEILRESDPVLIAVATILKEHTEITKVRVEGHTDNRGAAAMNKDLSNRRAASVVKWLVSYGIDKKRLSSKGFGLERPLDTNETDVGRQNNRRVEFHIEGAPTPKP